MLRTYKTEIRESESACTLWEANWNSRAGIWAFPASLWCVSVLFLRLCRPVWDNCLHVCFLVCLVCCLFAWGSLLFLYLLLASLRSVSFVHTPVLCFLFLPFLYFSLCLFSPSCLFSLFSFTLSFHFWTSLYPLLVGLPRMHVLLVSLPWLPESYLPTPNRLPGKMCTDPFRTIP